jgi:lambda family phage tail tape measure protein
MSDVIGTAKIVAELDSSGVEVGAAKGKRALADLGVSASKAGKQASDGIAVIGKGGDQAAQKVDAATRNMIGSIQRQIAAMEAGSKSGSEYYKVLAGQRGIDTTALKPYLDQLDAAANKQGKAGVSAAQMANNLRMVGPQVTDIVTSLQAGQKPLTVFIQQGGQLKDVFGGIGPAAKALGGYVLGLVNPYTLAAAAVAGLAYAYSQGSKEGDAYAKAIILSGNAAGTTVSQLQDMAKRIDSVTGTQSEAAAALAQFAASGNIAGQSMERFAAIAVKAEDLTGQAVKETVKQFSELGKSPVEASIKLNESTNYLTASLYQQIKALEDQGKTADAAALAQKAYADAMDSRLSKLDGQLGSIQRGWKAVADEAKEAWDFMLGVGRSQSTGDKLSSISSEIEAVQARLQRESGGGLLGNLLGKIDADKLAALKDAQAYTQENLRLENQAAAAQKASVDQARARIEFDKDGVQFLTNQAKLQKEITKAKNEGLAAGASQAEIDKRIADITTKYKDKGAISAAIQLDKAKLGLDIDTIQKAQDQLASIYKNSEQILESVHAAGLMSDKDYYESKREFIRLESDAQQDALQKELARYQQEKLSGKDKIDNDKKIADAQAKLATVRADTSAKLRVLDNQELTAINKKEASYKSARQAAQDYFDTLNRQQQRDLAGLGQGAQSRRRDAGLNQIEDRYAQQRLQLENQRALLEAQKDKDGNSLFTADEKSKYDERLSLIDEFQKKSIASYADYYSELMKKQGDWSLGAQEGLNNYLDDARNVFKQTENLVGDAFGGMEDALVGFVQTGKLSFGDLTKTIIADLARMEIKALASKVFGGGGAAGFLGSIGGALFSGFGSFGAMNAGVSASTGLSISELAGAFADGGDPPVGKVSLVGERGPELFVPKTAGTIIPNDKLGGKAINVTINQNNSFESGMDKAELQKNLLRMKEQTKAEVVDQLQRARVL